MVRKVTISLPDDLLDRIDAEAAERGESRSLIVQEASAAYLSQTVEERAQQARRARIDAAIRTMKRIAAKPSMDPRPSLEILREIRETHDGAPLWGTAEREEWERERRGGEQSDAGL